MGRGLRYGPEELLGGAVVKIVIVAHHTRYWEPLAEAVDADEVFVDRGWKGALWNHRQALCYASRTRERVWIMEDDAIPDIDFRARAQEWDERFPRELISGYLGRERPVSFQREIKYGIQDAMQRRQDFITLRTLVHGVCYSIPSNKVNKMVSDLRPSTGRAADFAIGAAWKRPVLYTIPSLVDHGDDEPVEKHPDGETRTSGRTAWVPPKLPATW